MDPIFSLAIASSVAAVTPLAFPLLGMAKGAVGRRPVGASGVGETASGACSQREVELSVRGRLYGERPRLAVRPLPRPARPAGGLVGGRYRLLERVGSGGMASVYRAHDELLRRDVAVKLIAGRLAAVPPIVKRFRSEAQLGTRLAHPNILSILDAGDEPRHFIVMELVDGIDAGRLLQRLGQLTPGETVHVVACVCEGLTYAHDHGVLHGDVSLPNILLRRCDGAAKLADFGLATSAYDIASKGVGKVMGTPGYVAPEILWGARPTPRSDLYSLGVVAYRFLAGPPGFRPRDPGATVPLASAAPRMPPLAEVRPDLPRGLIAAVQQAIAHDPGARQDSVAEFRAELIDEVAGAPLQQ